MPAEWGRLWGCTDSQEVGLEAAILERVRNSSLVECPRADNVTGLKRAAEAADVRLLGVRGRGAFGGRRSRTARTGGAPRSANAGMSSVNGCANHPHRKPEGSWATAVVPGSVGT